MVKEDNLEPVHLRKLFIGGLDYHTTDESLKAYFEQYGEIVDVIVMKDPQTKRSRGFGFVAFAESYMVDDAQKHRPHKVDGRPVDTKRAVPRDEINRPEASTAVKKLFVGGIKDIEEDELREVFSQFGEVINVSVAIDRETQKKRGFAFVEFSDSDPVDKACLLRELMISNQRVDVKKAIDRTEMSRRAGRGGDAQGWGGNQGGGNNNWSGNQSGYNNQGGGLGNQGAYGGNQGAYSGNQGNWSGNQGQGWGGNQGGYGGNQGGWGGNQGGAGGSWDGNQGYGGGNNSGNSWGGNEGMSSRRGFGGDKGY